MLKYTTFQLSIPYTFFTRTYVVWHYKLLTSASLDFRCLFSFPRNALIVLWSLLYSHTWMTILVKLVIKCVLCKTVVMGSITAGSLFEIALVYQFFVSTICFYRTGVFLLAAAFSVVLGCFFRQDYVFMWFHYDGKIR